MSIPDIILLACTGVVVFVGLLFTLRIRKQIIVRNVGKVSKSMEPEHNEQLAAFIDGLSKRYPEVSFAKLSRIAVAVSRWEVKRMTEIAEEELKRADRCKDLSDATAEQGDYHFWLGYEACAEYLLENIKPPKR